jgi:hypothetical protein
MITIKVLEDRYGYGGKLLMFKKNSIYNVEKKDGFFMGYGENQLVYTIAENQLKYKVISEKTDCITILHSCGKTKIYVDGTLMLNANSSDVSLVDAMKISQKFPERKIIELTE